MSNSTETTQMRPRKGMSLIEVMIALTLLVMLVASNTLLTMKFAERQQAVSLGAYRTAALSMLIGKYMAMPYDSLALRTGCTTVTASTTTPFGYTRCVTVTALTGQNSQVRIILTPAKLTRVDTVLFNRSKTSTSGPLG
jgi:prepilin-type N-terminal cleavage/methylation domain-containing protein